MLSPVRVRQQAVALLAAMMLLFTFGAVVLANAPSTSSANASVSGMTVTMSGTWSWPDQNDCNDRWVGWAVSWADPGAPGTAIASGFAVGTPGDSTVHTNKDCGSANAGGHGRTGTWGSISHTYTAPGTYNVCAVLYDVHIDTGKQQAHPEDLVASGNPHNKDNSVEDGKQAPTAPSCANVTVAAPANISVRNSVNSSSANPGDTLTYTIALSNSGGSAGTVDVSDNLGSVLAKGSLVSASGGGSLSGSTFTWNGVNVAVGGSTNLTVTVRLNATGWSGGTTSLTSTVTAAGTNCASGGDSACKTATTVSPSANLVVHKSVSDTSANPGDTLTYTITIQNTGAADATGVSASDNISALLAKGTFGSASNGGALNGSTVGWTGLEVDAGSTTTLSLSVHLNSSGWGSGSTTLNNTVVVPNSDCASGSSNASCKATTTVSTSPNLVVHQSVSAATGNPGDTLAYTIGIQNTGSGDADGVAVSAAISSVLAHASFASADNGGSLSGSSVSWPSFSLAAGASRTVTFSVKLDASGWPTGTTTLTSTVAVPNSDCAAGASNGNCKATTTVSAHATLVVNESVNASTANPGDTLSYVIKIQNTGNAAATGVDVTDDITTLLGHGSIGAISGGGGLSGNSVHWNNLSIDPGATSTLTFSVVLDASGWPVGTTNLPTTVVVAGSDCAAGSANANCDVSTSVTAKPILTVHNSVTATSADPGDSLTYTISVQNSGNAPAGSVDVTDDITALLAHGSFVSATSGGTLLGNTVHWDNRTFAAGSNQAFSYTVKLDLSGWPNGTTALATTAVVPGSDCASGASNSACRVSTSVTPHFGLAITKNASGGSSGPWASTYSATDGDTVWFQIKIANTGNATLSGMSLTDSLGIPSGQCSASPTSLAPGAGWTCTYFRIVHDGTTTNTATVDSGQTTAQSDTATVTATPAPAPAIAVAKTANPTQLPIGGGNVTYTFLVTNPGNVPLSNISVTDDRCVPLTLQSGDTNKDNKLDTSETWRYTCGATLTATATDTVTASGTFGSTKVTGSDKATVTVLVGAPALHLEVTASPLQLPVGGGTATYGYVVTNVGNSPLSNLVVTDDACSPVTYVSGDTNNNDRLDLTETWHFACSTTLTTTTTDHARASAAFGSTAVSDTDQATVTVATSAPAIHVVKAANPTSLPAGGGSVTYTYVVTNTGNTPLTGIVLKDDGCASITLTGGDTNANGRLDTGETWQYRCIATITVTTTNTVTATGHAGTVTVTDTDQATVAVTASNAAINVLKTASVNSLPAAGGSVTYSYVVSNKGNVPLANISVIDDKCASVTAKGGDTNGNSRLDVGESWTYTCSQTLTATTTNTVLATGFSNGQPVTDTDTALVTVGTPVQHTPRIGLTLVADPVVLPELGGSVTYTYTVANKGDVALSGVLVKDDTCSPIGAPTGDVNGNGLLDLTETWTYTCTFMVMHTTTNTATASGTADGQTVQALDMATVTLTPPAPTPTPTDSASPIPGQPTDGTQPGASPSPSSGTAIGGTGSANGSAAPGESGPTGAVQSVTSPPRGASQAPSTSANIQVNTGSTPSGMVMILVLMLGIAAAVVIMTLSKRTSNL
jgi:uncharacterized repeat protein (TIGR01451 family)